MKIVAHRGASLMFQENSVEGLIAASDMGAFAVECDVRKTADGVYILFHDEDLVRLCGDSRRVSELSFAEMSSALHAVGYSLSTLDELLSSYKGSAYILFDVAVALPDSEFFGKLSASGVPYILGVHAVDEVELAAQLLPKERILAFIHDAEMKNYAEYYNAGAGIIRLWENWLGEIAPAVLKADCPEAQVFIMSNSPETGLDGNCDSLANISALGADGVLLNNITLAFEFLASKAQDNAPVASFEEGAESDSGTKEQQAAPMWNRVNYSDVSAMSSYKPASKGLKVFAALMAGIILLSAVCVGGYFLGRGSYSAGNLGATVDVDLAAKPKDSDALTPAQVYATVDESIVGIRVYNSAGEVSDASGVIYASDGYVITNDHIYSEIGAPKFKIYMHDGSEHNATYVAGDAVSDLAVLKIEKGKGFKVTEFGDSNQLVCGENVVAVGRPNDATDKSSITGGMISLTRRRVKTTSSYSARLIQTDSAINPGSSGGALVNMYGQIVGITSSKLAGVEYDSIGFAIPTVTVKRVAEQLIKNGKVTDRAKLGISYTELNSVTAEINGFDNVGLYVAAVTEDSDIYGKVAEGDIITHINGIAITNDDIVLDILEDLKAGAKVTLTVVSEKNGTADYEVTLKANIGESSYMENIPAGQGGTAGGESGGETFDFPFGE